METWSRGEKGAVAREIDCRGARKEKGKRKKDQRIDWAGYPDDDDDIGIVPVPCSVYLLGT